MKKQLLVAGFLAGTFFANAQWSGTSPETMTGFARVGGNGFLDHTFHVGDGDASLHNGWTEGMIIKYAPGPNRDRALLELHAPDGSNRMVFQALSGATYFGSLDAKPLYINGADGPVTIGDDLGGANKLEVRTSHANDGIRISQKSNGYGAATLYLNNMTAGGKNWGLCSTGNGSFQGSGNFSIYDFNSNSDRLFINGSNGRVGIGTTNPGSRLEVSEDIYSKVSAFTTTANKAGLWALNTQNSYGLVVDGSGVGHIVNNINGPEFNLINFQQSNSAPQVWIGTRKPITPHTDFKFAVDGKVLAQSVYVTPVSQWADYVFAPDYKLATLSDVEKFYKKNSHLPEIPSAKEVEEKGIDVGEMNTLLLKKVEELTLYMVDLNKKVEKLEAENKSLKRN